MISSLFAVEHVITLCFCLFGGSICLPIVRCTTLVTSWMSCPKEREEKVVPASDGMTPIRYTLHRTSNVVLAIDRKVVTPEYLLLTLWSLGSVNQETIQNNRMLTFRRSV